MPTKNATRKAASPKAAPTPKPQPAASRPVKTLKQLSRGRRDIRALSLDDIEPLHIPGADGKPVRFNVREIDLKDPKVRAELDELKGLIREHGQKEPGRGKMQPNGKFGLTDGERRSIVLRELRTELPKDPRFRTMEVCPESQGTTPDERDYDLLNCNSGVQLNMLEQGRLYHRRKVAGDSVAVIAQKAGGKTEQHIYDCLKLIGLPEEVQAAVRSGQIAASTVVNIAKKSDASQVKAIVKTTIATAKAQGKKRASNRHVPAGSGQKKRKSGGSRGGGGTGDLFKSAESKQEEKERAERVADAQADSAGKLQLLLESTVPKRCTGDRYDSVRWTLDYLNGKKDLAEMIDFLHGQEKLI